MSAIFLFACGSTTSALPWLNAAIKYFSISKLEKVKKKRENYTKLPILFYLFAVRSCGKSHNRDISFQVLYIIWNSTENFRQSWSQSNCLHNSVAVGCIWVIYPIFWWHFKMHVPKGVKGSVLHFAVMYFIFCNSALPYHSSSLLHTSKMSNYNFYARKHCILTNNLLITGIKLNSPNTFSWEPYKLKAYINPCPMCAGFLILQGFMHMSFWTVTVKYNGSIQICRLGVLVSKCWVHLWHPAISWQLKYIGGVWGGCFLSFPVFSFFLDDSLSMPSVVSEQEAYLMGAIGRRRFSSHLSSVSAPQAEVGMLPSQR